MATVSDEKKRNAREWARATDAYPDRAHIEIRQEWADRIAKLEPPPPYAKVKKEAQLGRSILVIGDTHMTPEHHNRRMEWLGHAIIDLRPDTVICMGDAWSMSSLATFDKAGSREWSGRRVAADLDAGIDGRLRTQKVLDDYNRPRKKKDRVNPKRVALLGNHEQRIQKFIDSPEGRPFEGIIGLESLQQTKPELGGWEQVPFLQGYECEGIIFSHYFGSGVMNRPASSTNTMLNKQHVSCIAGHSHLYQHSQAASSADGLTRHAIMAGCFFEHNEAWASQANLLWRRGLLLLTDCDGLGDFDHRWIGMNQIKARYS